MNLDPATLIGPVSFALFSVLSGAVLVLKIRENLAEKPDPKLTYATQVQLEQLRRDVAERERGRDESHGRLAEIVRQNADHLSQLMAMQRSLNARLSELARRTERLSERMPRR